MGAQGGGAAFGQAKPALAGPLARPAACGRKSRPIPARRMPRPQATLEAGAYGAACLSRRKKCQKEQAENT